MNKSTLAVSAALLFATVGCSQKDRQTNPPEPAPGEEFDQAGEEFEEGFEQTGEGMEEAAEETEQEMEEAGDEASSAIEDIDNDGDDQLGQGAYEDVDQDGDDQL